MAEPFPASQEEADKFFNDIVTAIHDSPRIEEKLQLEEPALPTKVGLLTQQLLMQLFADVVRQGRQVDQEFAIMAIRVTVSEMLTMAEAMGQEVTPEIQDVAIQVAGDSLNEVMSQMYDEGQGAPAPQGQPAVPQGPPQGPPPAQGMLQGGM